MSSRSAWVLLPYPNLLCSLHCVFLFSISCYPPPPALAMSTPFSPCSGLFQMPLAVLSFMFTIKPVPSTILWDIMPSAYAGRRGKGKRKENKGGEGRGSVHERQHKGSFYTLALVGICRARFSHPLLPFSRFCCLFALVFGFFI